MDVVIDTSALVAVIVGEPERDRIIELTAGKTLIGPGSIPWKVGNAFSAMLKQERLTLDETHKGLTILASIPVRYVKPDFAHSLTLSHQINMYAYDAYFLDCAIRHKAPLLTLDRKLKVAAKCQCGHLGGMKCRFTLIRKLGRSLPECWSRPSLQAKF